MSAVITGLICRIREVAVGYRQALPHWALSGTQWDPHIEGWSLAETIQQNQKSKDYLGHGFSPDFLMQTLSPSGHSNKMAFFLIQPSKTVVAQKTMCKHMKLPLTNMQKLKEKTKL